MEYLEEGLLSCTTCLQHKSKSCFYKDKSIGKRGYEYKCKDCLREKKIAKQKEKIPNLLLELDKQSLEGEVWKDIPNYEELYQVSNFGRVRSLPRTMGENTKSNKGSILAESFCIGYKQVSLTKDGKSQSKRVHRLVMLAFIGKSKNNMVIDHINADRSDNRLENLRYCTQRENSQFKSLREKGYVGVSKLGKSERWVSSINIEKRRYTIGIFDTKEEAIEAYKDALYKWDNFSEKPSYQKRVPSSIYKGVSYRKKEDMWESTIKINKIQYALGTYNTEEEAAEARKNAEDNYNIKGILPHYINPKHLSKYKYLSLRNNKWQIYISAKGFKKYLGVYETEQEAVDFMRKYIEENKLDIKIEK